MSATTLKRSRQRDAILAFLQTRKDHPTADTVYMNVRNEFPNISLGTVYRNLTLLTELGMIQKLNMGGGVPDRFDATAQPHYHFICTECGCVLDLNLDTIEEVDRIADAGFDGKITGHVTYFYGKCRHCLDTQEKGKQ